MASLRARPRRRTARERDGGRGPSRHSRRRRSAAQAAQDGAGTLVAGRAGGPIACPKRGQPELRGTRAFRARAWATFRLFCSDLGRGVDLLRPTQSGASRRDVEHRPRGQSRSQTNRICACPAAGAFPHSVWRSSTPPPHVALSFFLLMLRPACFCWCVDRCFRLPVVIRQSLWWLSLLSSVLFALWLA